MKKQYFMMAQEGRRTEVTIYGDITAWDYAEGDMSSYTLSRLLQEADADTIDVHINSYGGEVKEGLAIYNALVNHPARVRTWCDGFACSAASVVFMAGDERVMNAASLLMVHNASCLAAGNAEDLRKQADDLDKISNAAANAYRRVMTLDEEELQEMLAGETWLDAGDALAAGFATDVVNEPEGKSPTQSARASAADLILWAQNMMELGALYRDKRTRERTAARQARDRPRPADRPPAGGAGSKSDTGPEDPAPTPKQQTLAAFFEGLNKAGKEQA